uniref:protein kinase domain-containing protein n=1 Tax=Herbidospora sakaeratensis TaxID=564415 RepID=UPI000B3114F3|nr:protein kinase [Herbidospora sakaeratensis]
MPDFLGRYRLDPIRLGRGGMGEVWGATDTRLDRRVAIKYVLLPDTELNQRFIREARALSKLTHPGVPALYDFGRDADRHYMIMQFIDGNTLRDVVAEHAPLPIGWVASIGAQIAAVLHAAHSHGILHRDLKPSNLILGRDGSVSVLDFGLAFLHDADTVELTTTGHQLGTAAYMSPEQVEAKPASEKTDVYALGCVLYEIATGLPLFTGPGDHSVKTQHVTTPATPAGRYRADMPRGLDELLLAMVEKNPADRPRGMREVHEGLMPYLSGTSRLGDMTENSPSPLTLYAQAVSRTVAGSASGTAPPAEARPADFHRTRRDARSLIRDSRYGEAVELLNEALARTPDAHDLREQLAEGYFSAHDYERAAREYRRLADVGEAEQAFHHRLQEAVCHVHLGQLDSALDLMVALLADTQSEDNPQALELRRHIGELERDAGHRDRARRTFTGLLADLRRIFGEEHPATDRVRQLLGAIA